MEYASINKIIPFSSVDGPGNRTALFFQSCNFNCKYCHNPETINVCVNCGKCIDYCKVGALKMENRQVIWNEELCVQCDECIKNCPHDSTPKIYRWSTDQALERILENESFISGITVSGGECTLSETFLIELFQKVKEHNLTCFVDSNGYKSFKQMEKLTEVMDAAMIDLKAYDEAQHIELTGKTNKTVIENIEYLAKIGKLYEIRTVVVPGVLDNSYTIDLGSKLLAKINPKIRYKLIKYRSLGVREELLDSYTPSDDDMDMLKKIAEKNGCENVVLV